MKATVLSKPTTSNGAKKLKNKTITSGMSTSTTDVSVCQQNKGKHKRVMKLLNLPTGPGAAPYEVQPQPSWKDKGRGLSNRMVHSSSVCVFGSQ